MEPDDAPGIPGETSGGSSEPIVRGEKTQAQIEIMRDLLREMHRKNQTAARHSDLKVMRRREGRYEIEKHNPKCERQLRKVGPRAWWCDSCKVKITIGGRLDYE